MQTQITDRAAIAFAGSFYDAIAAGDPLEAAMAEGRQAIRNEVGNSEGAIPALYLRRDDGQLFRRIDRSDLAQWLHPQDDLVQVLTQRFVGRSFVFKEIAEFLANDEKRGYFLLRGDPGIGKSALLAEWIRRENAVYHFNVRNDNGCNRSRHFLSNVCAQLILRYQLPYPTLPDDATSGPRLLEQLLREISEQRVDVASHLIHHGARVPRRVGQEVVQSLGIGIRNDLGHTLDVAPCCLEQSAQVPTGLRADIASAQTEERRIFLAERQESPTQSLQGRWVMALLLPITNLSGVASTGILDDSSIVPYYAYQVAWIQEVLESDKVEVISFLSSAPQRPAGNAGSFAGGGFSRRRRLRSRIPPVWIAGRIGQRPSASGARRSQSRIGLPDRSSLPWPTGGSCSRRSSF